MDNPMADLPNIYVRGFAFIWEMNLFCENGFIGLHDVKNDFNVVSTGVGDLDEILVTAKKWDKKIRESESTFICLWAEIDGLVADNKGSLYETIVEKCEAFENWLNK